MAGGLALLFLGLVAAVVWTFWSRFGRDDVGLRERGFAVLSDEAVRVDFDVTPPPGETAWCLVRARGASGAEVGYEHVPVPSRGGGSAVLVQHVLTTTERAVTGEVTRCELSPPPAGRPTAEPSP